MNKKVHDQNKIVKTIENALNFYEFELSIPLTMFMFQSPLHWNIMTIIALASFKENNSTSFQDICKKINSKVGSKSSIQTIIKNGILQGFINKKENSSDKRIKNLTLSHKAKDDYVKWLELDAETYKPIL